MGGGDITLTQSSPKETNDTTTGCEKLTDEGLDFDKLLNEVRKIHQAETDQDLSEDEEESRLIIDNEMDSATIPHDNPLQLKSHDDQGSSANEKRKMNDEDDKLDTPPQLHATTSVSNSFEICANDVAKHSEPGFSHDVESLISTECSNI